MKWAPSQPSSQRGRQEHKSHSQPEMTPLQIWTWAQRSSRPWDVFGGGQQSRWRQAAERRQENLSTFHQGKTHQIIKKASFSWWWHWQRQATKWPNPSYAATGILQQLTWATSCLGFLDETCNKWCVWMICYGIPHFFSAWSVDPLSQHASYMKADVVYHSLPWWNGTTGNQQ